MSCYHPMVLINSSDMTDPIQRAIVDRLKMVHHKDKHIKSVNTLLIPREVAEKEGLTLRENNAVLVPCGRCVGCYLDYSRDWAIRIMSEVRSYDENYFVTLTYDDDHLPQGSQGFATLVPDHVSEFMKTFREMMRQEYGVTGIRFFACGEYGGKDLRPHYHIILLNCPLKDLKDKFPTPVDGTIRYCRRYDSNGDLLKHSDIIHKAWNKGLCPIGEVTFESCAYVSRYVLKKAHDYSKDYYDKFGVVPEFVRMSRRPGIGYQFFMQELDHIYEYDNFSFLRGDQVINVKPGRYADKLLKKVDEQRYYDLKKKRRDDFYDSIDTKDFDGVDIRVNNHKAEYNKEHSIKLLKRNL